jgi:hypothetical protein
VTIKIVFGEGMELASQQEADPWARITYVKAARTATTVGVEDKAVHRQGAHATADVVLERGMERLLYGEDWCGAWRIAAGLWSYLRGIATVWQADEVLGNASKTMVKLTIATANSHEETARRNFRRGGVNLENAWYTEPSEGSYEVRKAARTYFDHLPQDDEVPGEDYQVARWVPNLDTRFVNVLVAEMEEWVKTRVRLPWTSLDTDSFNTSDKTGSATIEEIISAIEKSEASDSSQASDNNNDIPEHILTKDEAYAIARGMLVSFDFIPPTINKSRTLRHAGAVAARHVVEHFKLHPNISVDWRGGIATAFLAEWQKNTVVLAEKIAQTVQESKKSGAKRLKSEAQSSSGLDELLAGWDDVSKAYDHFVTEFCKAALG